ncbi:MAG TPA: GtrA family protein [Vicinamibacterales bacterium]|nr:GtrA family protein [Vicinamibacterales bacterium]
MTRAIAATQRTFAFLAVAAGGFAIQTSIVALLTRCAGVTAEAATAIGVALAVLHNFLWHERWTWSDRRAGRRSRLRTFAAYQLATGLTSVAGNVLFVAIAVRTLAVDATIANVAAVVALSAVNYAIADRWVFARQVVVVAFVLAVFPGTAAAQPSPETIREWDAHVARVENGRHEASEAVGGDGRPIGRELRVHDGIVHEWSGSVRIPGVTVPQLIGALTVPGTPPPQDDVLEARVLERSGDTLRVYLKLQRSALVTVTYDTEHTVTFEKESATLARSRSVATSIREVGGGDRGFLWRLNSYWTYRAVDGGVQVDVLSVSLSRTVPTLARPIVAPVAGRIARESLRRTLDAMRQFGLELAARERSAEAFALRESIGAT